MVNDSPLISVIIETMLSVSAIVVSIVWVIIMHDSKHSSRAARTSWIGYRIRSLV